MKKANRTFNPIHQINKALNALSTIIREKTVIEREKKKKERGRVRERGVGGRKRGKKKKQREK